VLAKDREKILAHYTVKPLYDIEAGASNQRKRTEIGLAGTAT
jgi:hypothetical protein